MKKPFQRKPDKEKIEKNAKISKDTSLIDPDYNRKRLFRKTQDGLGIVNYDLTIMEIGKGILLITWKMMVNSQPLRG